MSQANVESASDFFDRLNMFAGLSQADQVLRAAWYLHAVQKIDRFQPKDVTSFFNSLSLQPPNVHVNLKRLTERKPRILMTDKRGYYLEGKCFRALNMSLAKHQSVVAHLTSEALHGLSSIISDAEQRSFLAETINCYRVGAFRAAIVMAWNLAYDHLTRWILADSNRSEKFNTSLAIRLPKKSLNIMKLEDFEELKEFDVVDVAFHAKLLSKSTTEILKEKLKRRNAAAHPSGITITQAQADDVITDLVHNVISKLDIAPK